jgi:glycosyltransferase involved in cell wall biosynthesis
MKEKKKALFFILNSVGGAERMTINIAKLLPEEEWEIVCCKVVIPCVLETSRVDDLIPPSFKRTLVCWDSQVKLFQQIVRVLKQYRPDVVFSSAMHINQRLMLISPFFPKIRFVIRNNNYIYTLSRLKRFALKLTYQLATCIIAQNKEMKDELVAIGIKSDRIKVIQNILDRDTIDMKATELSPFPDDKKVRFVAAGRFCREKGFDLLLKAFSRVLVENPNSELYILGATDYGGGAYFNELKGIVQSTGMEDNVVFTGYTKNPYRYIRNATAFVLSSRVEGLPNVLIESQYLGTPAAAIKCIPIIERIIEEGTNGYLAEPEDITGLAEAMVKASKLGKVKMTYQPGSKSDFLNCFTSR